MGREDGTTVRGVPEAVLSAWLTAHKAFHRQCFPQQLHTLSNLGGTCLARL